MFLIHEIDFVGVGKFFRNGKKWKADWKENKIEGKSASWLFTHLVFLRLFTTSASFFFAVRLRRRRIVGGWWRFAGWRVAAVVALPRLFLLSPATRKFKNLRNFRFNLKGKLKKIKNFCTWSLKNQRKTNSFRMFSTHLYPRESTLQLSE